jgi:hypothetical protein
MTGNIGKEVLDAVLNALPVEISFVDENDTVRYFNKNGDRIFPRPPAVIDRKVQDCHPKKSLHKVSQILDDFKNNKRSSAEFWIDLKGRKIYIRYFAVRDENRKYLGCLEVSQDITDIQKIKGEKRLL